MPLQLSPITRRVQFGLNHILDKILAACLSESLTHYNAEQILKVSYWSWRLYSADSKAVWIPWF